MKRIIYQSTALAPMSEGAIAELLVKARANNDRDNISGMLLYVEPDGPESPGQFVQAIEGPDEAIDACFDRIQTDPRHTGVRVIAEDNIYTRSFENWSMGHRELAPGDLERLLSLSQITAEAISDLDDAEKALTLLGA